MEADLQTMTVIDLERLSSALASSLGLVVEVGADEEGHVHVRLPGLSACHERRACAICRLLLGSCVHWTIRVDA